MSNKSFMKQLRDYTMHPEKVGEGKHAAVAAFIALVLGVVVALIGFNIIPLGKLGFNSGFAIMSYLLIFTALTAFGSKKHRKGNPDVEPASALLAASISAALVFLTFLKDMGAFSAVLGS